MPEGRVERMCRMISSRTAALSMRCKRMALYQAENPLPPYFFNMPEPFSRLWKEFLQLQDVPSIPKNRDKVSDLHVLNEQKKGIFINLAAQGFYARFPVLILREDGWHAIYPIANTSARDYHALEYWLNRKIAAACGIKIVHQEILHLNKEYSRQQDLDVFQLFISSPRLFKARGGYCDLTIDEMMEELDQQYAGRDILKELKEFFEKAEFPRTEKISMCTAPRKCLYYEDCFNEEELPDNSIRFLTSSRSRHDMEARGIHTLAQADPALIEGTEMQAAQILADRKGGLQLDVPALSSWFSRLQKPLCFLDFEWDTWAVPPYAGMKPLDVMCFQYSLHIQSDERLEHRNFFSMGDCRKDMIESLIRDMPAQGSIVVFNMAGGEKLRLQQLAGQFPEYAGPLEAMCQRMVDLAEPFERGLFYDIRQRGKYSLKTLLKLFDSPKSYTDLAVQDGLQAVQAYRQIQKDPALEQETGHQISEYCSLDTLAEKELLDGLQQYLERN